MKNGSKNGAKINLKSIPKRGPKIDAKMEPKRVQPPTPGRPPRRFPSKKGTVQKENKQTEKPTTRSCSAEKVSRARNECQHASGAYGPKQTFTSQGPQGAATSTRTKGEWQKERRTKKERVRKVEKGTQGFEHASGQRPGEFLTSLKHP